MKTKNIDQKLEMLKRRHGRAFGKFKSGYQRKIRRLERLKNKLNAVVKFKSPDVSDSQDYFGE